MDESIKKLPPHERVAALKRLQQEKKKEIEELEKKSKEEMQEAEQALVESLREEEQEAKIKAKELEEQLLTLQREQGSSLDDMVAHERSQSQQNANMESIDSHYDSGKKSSGQESYNPMNPSEEDRERMGYSNNMYQQQKNDHEERNHYKGSQSEDLVDQLDVGKNMLHKLGYKH